MTYVYNPLFGRLRWPIAWSLKQARAEWQISETNENNKKKKVSLTLSFRLWRGILHDLKLAMWPFLSASTS